ncbi:type II secretion system F family protein [Aestuariivirga sp.]|uniref:type II secretion system F family protein n=1 Tax=Aestuariivirga sp. TaxID=2650926 RepID=UPI00391CE272
MVEQLTSLIAARGDLIAYVAVFLAVAFVTIAVSSVTATWSDVRRRATAGETGVRSAAGEGATLIRGTEPDFLKGLVPTDEDKKTELMRFLNSAGYYGTPALMWFQAIRLGVAVVLGMATALLYGRMFPDHSWVMGAAASVAMTFMGYILPRSIVSVRRDKLFEEHRQGFPDFLDLLVICVEAGIGVESAMDRISRDMAADYPSLARNLGFMSLELRAGKSTREALENLALRLGIPEAKSFATLIQQSEELGTSLVQSLRVYSDEMRAKRLARAEEKAHALPVKLVLPLALFIFPVILGITLMPVAMKLFRALGI